MMDDLDRSIFFNSIFLVLWAVAFVPYTIREKKYGLLLATFLPLIPFEIYLSWNLREYPFNIMAGIASHSQVWRVVFLCTILMNEQKKGKNHERAN